MNKKKLQILEAAKTLFRTKGFAETSVTDIIKLANVSKGTFYNHFESKHACFIAILDDVHEKTIIKRKLIYEQNPHYKIETLIEELVAFHQIILENDLLDTMFQLIGNKDGIKIFEEIEKHTLYELKWLANRLIDIYGKRIEAIAYDYAASYLGTIQSIHRTVTMLKLTNTISIRTIIENTLKKLEPIMFSHQASDVILLDASLFKDSNTLNTHEEINIEEIIEELEEFYIQERNHFSEESEELTIALLDALNNPEKIYILKTLSNSFTQSFSGTSLEHKANNLYRDIFNLIS